MVDFCFDVVVAMGNVVVAMGTSGGGYGGKWWWLWGDRQTEP